MTVDWVCKHHDELGKEQLYAIMRLRNEVFVVEQKCIYQDLDGQDLSGDTHHLMAWQDNELVAYLRLLDPESQGGDVVIGRVIVAPVARGTGLGYYGQYGFVVAGEEYLEDDIPHIGMRRD